MKKSVRLTIAGFAAAGAIAGAMGMSCFLNNNSQQTNPALIKEKIEERVAVKC
ncbi:MAG: hypothetical protein HUJ54_07925 [Erysipelotrichaceae bacterium]|nr:hypothetical protein [Erysipelotrichaceae bacterium]